MKGLTSRVWGQSSKEYSWSVGWIWEATGRKAKQMESQGVKTETLYSRLESAAMSNGEWKVGGPRLDSDYIASCRSREASSGLSHRVEIVGIPWWVASGNHNSSLIRGVIWKKRSLEAAPSAVIQKRRPKQRGYGEGGLYLTEFNWYNCHY